MRVLVSTSAVGSVGPRSGLGEALTGLKRMMLPVGVSGGGAEGLAVWMSAPEVTSQTPESQQPSVLQEPVWSHRSHEATDH